jgi:site-specific DNA-methyltransferase (adenine-specific)
MIQKDLLPLACPINKLSLLPGNPRRGDVEAVKASLEKFGQRKPIVVRKSDQVVIAGNHTLQAAQALGWSEIAVVWVDDDDTMSKAFALADNRTAELGDYDEDALAALIGEVGALDPELLEASGWDSESVSELLDKMQTELPVDVDEVPEDVPTISKLGDVWLLGEHRVMCGDSTDANDVAKLMNAKKADMVFTDPPYGVDYDGGHADKNKRRKKLANDDNANIYGKCLPLLFAESKNEAAMYLWFSDSKSSAVISAVISAGYEIRNTLIWNKNLAQFGAIGAQYKSKHEPCIYAFKSGKAPYWNGPTNEVSVWDIARESKNEFHPTQKPVDLGIRAMNNSCPRNGLVLDLFGGSGSTLIAAHETNRVAYLMELDPHYVDVICARFQKLTGILPVLESDGLAHDFSANA